MNKIVTVIVTYNRKELLDECINALLNQSYKDFDILIIDNASTDNTYESVVKKYESERVKYINTGKNLGGAGGFNIGIKEAITHGYDYAWVMDDDSVPEVNALSSLINKKQILSDNFSFIGSFVKWTDDTVCKMNRVTIKSDAFFENYHMIDEKLFPIDTTSFVGCFMNLKYSKEVGLPIKEFFIYGDDVEYTKRLSKMAPAYLDMESVIVHKMKENVSIDINLVNENRIDRYFYDFRNWTYILKKQGFKGFIRVIHRYFIHFNGIIKKSPSKKIKRIWVITKGTISGLFFNPKIEIVTED